LPAIRARAAALDAEAAFPLEDLADLRMAGVLRAPIPHRWGGPGLGTEPTEAMQTLALFQLLGRGNMALGRLIEAHINALRLAFRFGDEALQQRVAQDAKDGHLCGLWVTDPPGGGLQLWPDGSIEGEKQFCSGAFHATRAVVTADDWQGGTRLVYTAADAGFHARELPGGLAGMRAAATGQVRFGRTPGSPFGTAGDYLKEPDFSCGAWRTAAVTLGGIEALGEELRQQLVTRGRGTDPHQQARVGQALIAAETARLWAAAAAPMGEAGNAGATTYVGMARLAVERAGLDMIELVQRSLGLAALTRGNPAERLCRDLATYLRQPATDMVLTEAAMRAMSA
jgi:alkylation response protein AidB-like acyl-CoA dehydrogenase